GLQPIGHQVEEASKRDHPDAARLIRDMQATLVEHERLLGDRLTSLGTSPTTAVQDAAAAVAGFVAGVYNEVRTEAIAKSLRDDYTFLSHCSVSWLMLMTTARALQEHDTEELAERGYRDTARLVMEIDRVLPRVVVKELQQDGLQAQDVSAWAEHQISEAWTSRKVGSSVA
ncbi:MAG TPA: hypothetical protein VGQ62_05315, partial [Chloroflexota bacterium]|nr:hypothetical protein [Chloroflexota bacterium]